MPASGWNGKLDHGGNGGYGGSLGTPAGFMVNGLLRGYATTGTDMGHSATAMPGGSFALGHPEKLVDWGSRANHVTSVAAKLIIRAFYGASPFLSYFTGCSDGGHEALLEAQRFPSARLQGPRRPWERVPPTSTRRGPAGPSTWC